MTHAKIRGNVYNRFNLINHYFSIIPNTFEKNVQIFVKYKKFPDIYVRYVGLSNY